jgi:anti-sigma regulatory factor (Ser/Thr protein kinase)
MTEQFSLSVDSRLERLGEIAEFIEKTAQAVGMNDDQLYDVQMAVDEACTNVIEHAYGGRQDGTIDITCEKRSGNLVIVIRDFGEQFDPKQVEQPRTKDPLSKRNVGGLGIFFMKKMMDKVEFKFSPSNGNQLTMVKKIKK